MKNINSHRNKKVNMFQNSIKQLSKEIEKLEEFRSDPDNQDMFYYYDNNIAEKRAKIKELEEFIENITCRIEGKEAPKRQVKPEVRQETTK